MAESDSNASKWAESVYGTDCFLGKVEYPPGGRFGPASLDKLVIVVILSGKMEMRSSSATYTLHQNECGLLLPDIPFTLQFSPFVPTRHHFACIHAKHIPDDMRTELFRSKTSVPCSSHLVSLIELAVGLSSTRHAGRDEQLKALTLSVFHEFHRCILKAQADIPSDAVDRALSYIFTHYSKPLDADSIAAACGLSRQHLTVLLREKTGKTIREHLWSHRTEKAHDLLIDTGLQLGEIAERTGFQNPYHLSRKLKLHYGESPKFLRRKAWRSEAGDHE